MASATIFITDEPGDKMNVRLEFDPEISEAGTESPAQMSAYTFLDWLSEKLGDGDEFEKLEPVETDEEPEEDE